MPFITQGPEVKQVSYGVNKTNWKFLLIIVILAIVVGGGALWYVNTLEQSPASSVSHVAIESPKTEQKSTQEQACIDSGGIVTIASCCKSSNDFPSSCLIGACGCALENSHEVKACDCGEGKCFDGEKCVSGEVLKPEAQCQFNEMIFYYRDGCPWCQKVKNEGTILKIEELGVTVTQINTTVGPIKHEISGVPTFIINETVFTGYRTFEELKELLGCQ